jgi:hypothetical protein
MVLTPHNFKNLQYEVKVLNDFEEGGGHSVLGLWPALISIASLQIMELGGKKTGKFV